MTDLQGDVERVGETGHATQTPNGSSIKSVRVTQKVRALAYREGDHMRLL